MDLHSAYLALLDAFSVIVLQPLQLKEHFRQLPYNLNESK